MRGQPAVLLALSVGCATPAATSDVSGSTGVEPPASTGVEPPASTSMPSTGTEGTTSKGDADSTGAATTGGDCLAGAKPGPAGATDGLVSGLGVNFNVRTPADYEPTVARPLIVVYAPGGASASGSERFTGLTDTALAAGFIVAFADSYIPASPRTIGQMADIAAEVASNWCVDPSRVHYTGDSGGGTTTGRVAAYDTGMLPVASAAPVAGGMPADELTDLRCPSPRSIVVHHTTGDTVFPVTQGYGGDVAQWFAECFACRPEADVDGDCRWYPGCTDGVLVGYCERRGPHGLWPDNEALVQFFAGAVATSL